MEIKTHIAAVVNGFYCRPAVSVRIFIGAMHFLAADDAKVNSCSYLLLLAHGSLTISFTRVYAPYLLSI